jgi:hypothetical protein
VVQQTPTRALLFLINRNRMRSRVYPVLA